MTPIGTHSLSAANNAAVISSATASSGSQIWFSTDQAGSSPIESDLLQFSSGSSVFLCNALIPAISSLSGATIYLHVGDKPGSITGNPYPADFTAVYPLISDFDDATTNNLDGTAFGIVKVRD